MNRQERAQFREQFQTKLDKARADLVEAEKAGKTMSATIIRGEILSLENLLRFEADDEPAGGAR